MVLLSQRLNLSNKTIYELYKVEKWKSVSICLFISIPTFQRLSERKKNNLQFIWKFTKPKIQKKEKNAWNHAYIHKLLMNRTKRYRPKNKCSRDPLTDSIWLYQQFYYSPTLKPISNFDLYLIFERAIQFISICWLHCNRFGARTICCFVYIYFILFSFILLNRNKKAIIR